MEEKRVQKHRAFVGIIGMRVDPRTRPAATLEQFLAQIPPSRSYLPARHDGLCQCSLCGQEHF